MAEVVRENPLVLRAEREGRYLTQNRVNLEEIKEMEGDRPRMRESVKALL